MPMKAQSYWSRIYHSVGESYEHPVETPEDADMKPADFKTYVKVETHTRGREFGIRVGVASLDNPKTNRTQGHLLLTDIPELQALPAIDTWSNPRILTGPGYSSLLVLFLDEVKKPDEDLPLDLEMNPINVNADNPGLELRLQYDNKPAFKVQLTPPQTADFITVLRDIAKWWDRHGQFEGYFSTNTPVYMAANGDTVHINDRPDIDNNEYDIE